MQMRHCCSPISMGSVLTCRGVTAKRKTRFEELDTNEEAVAEISDGLEELRSVMSLREIASLIERTARWVSPETFGLLPLWFPEHGRRGLFYKENWSAAQMNKSR